MAIDEDIKFIERVLAGDSDSFSYIVNRYKDKAYNLCFSICGNREEANDLAQDSFIKAYRALKSFRMKSSFSTWLYRIVYNTAISHIRKKQQEVLSLDDIQPGYHGLVVQNDSEREEEVDHINYLINIAMQNIGSTERALISLYYYDEMCLDEISGVTGMSKQYIKVKLFRTRKKMLDIITTEKKKLMKQTYTFLINNSTN